MLELARYEARRRRRGTAVLTVLVGVFGLLMVAFYPSMSASGVDFEAYAESLPPAVRAAFNIQAFTTVEGFLAVEFYQFVWVLLLGIYVAYAAGAALAGEIERGRLDLTLAAPVRRRRVLVEKWSSLVAPVLVLTVVIPPVMAVGIAAIDETIALDHLVALHLLAVPYLTACLSIGLLISVLVSRGDIAQRGAIGAVFGLFLLDSVSAGTDYELLGALSPTRYFDPTAVLVSGEYDLAGTAVLLAMTGLLLAISMVVFERRDV